MKAGWGLLALGAVIAGVAVWAPSARAGSYDVLSCSIDGGFFPNNAWHLQNNLPGDARYLTKTTCGSPSDPLQARLAAGSSFPGGLTFAGLEFDAPAGTTISDVALDARHVWSAPPNNQTYTLTLSSSGPFTGTGEFNEKGTADWYATSGSVDKRVLVSRHTSAAWLTVSSGCEDAAGCTLDASAQVYIQLFGSRVTITDSTPPALTGPSAGDGLLAPGGRSGDEPVTFSATDNVGIRRAEIVDVTDAANPSVVASADYNAIATAQNARCGYTRPRPCPDLKNEAIAASPAVAGHRTLLLRVADAAGNSRFFRLGYRAYKGDDAFVARSTSALNVRARISARGPRHVRAHGVAVFTGRLVGRPFPPRGVTLDLQIFQPRVGWRVFGTTRTRKNGRFAVRYQFQPASRGRFTFRLRLRPNDAYPYTRGSSGRMRVRVG